MERIDKRTQAFQTFERNHTQSFELTGLVELGGKTKFNQYKTQADNVAQQVVGVDIEEYLSWPEEKKLALQVPQESLEEMQAITKEVLETHDRVVLLTTVTLPNVLLTYLITIFEAYLNDIITAMYEVRPNLLEAVIQKRSPQNQANFAGKSIAQQVDYLFLATELKDVFKKILQKSLDLDMSIVWSRAGTSYSELRRAKLIRNLYVHRGGIIDEDFKIDTGDQKLEVGKLYPLTFNYLKDVSHKMLFVAMRIDVLATHKYPELHTN